MLITLFHEKTGWKHLPFATFVLIAINILVYSVVQNNSTIDDASHYYFSSKLYQHEFPHYIRYLKRNRPKFIQKLGPLSNQDQRQILYKSLIFNRLFNLRLEAELVITKADKNYPIWSQKRIAYKQLYTRIPLLNYGFIASENNAKTTVSYLFLHKSTGQLISNMIFLLIMGFALEKILGRIMFCVTYIGSGIFAAEFFAILNDTATIPVIGASSAILSLLAAFTIIFGLRKIKFYYWNFFNIGHFHASAIFLLPLWLSYLLIQMVNPTHYIIQLGGLVTGVSIALIYKLIHAQLNIDIVEPEPEPKEHYCQTSLNQALQALARLDYSEAATLFRSLLHENPADTEILEHYYTALTQLPVTEAYHTVTLRLLKQRVSTVEEAETHLRRYQYYMKRTGTSTRIKPQHTLVLAQVFARFGLVQEAEKIVCNAIKHRPEEAILPELLLILANAFYKLNQEDVQIHYLSLLIKTYPHTEEALTATTFLYEKPVQYLKIH